MKTEEIIARAVFIIITRIGGDELLCAEDSSPCNLKSDGSDNQDLDITTYLESVDLAGWRGFQLERQQSVRSA